MRQSSRREQRSAARRQTTLESGLALAEAWQASGETVAAFARARGIPAHRVYYWKRRCEAAADIPEDRAFLALEVAPSVEPAPKTPIEVCVGDLRVRFTVGVARETFIAALRWAQEAVAR